MTSYSIRAGTRTDLAHLVRIYNHYIVHTPYTFDVAAQTVESRQRWFSQYAASGPHRLVVAASSDSVVGYATSGPFHSKPAYHTSVETSVYLDPDVLQAGLGTTLYGALFSELAGADVHRAYAGITIPNEASTSLHKKFAFRLVATYHEVGFKFGKYWSTEWYEKRLNE